MKIRRFAAMAMASMMVLSMAACGGSQPAATTAAPAAPAATEAPKAEETKAEAAAETTAAAAEAAAAGGNIGVCIYKFDDAFMTTYRNIINTVKTANIPTVLINREPTADQMSAYDKLCYVGCDARQSGTMQGELILETEKKGDINGDGKVSYIMIQGDPENIDAQYRTEFSVKALTDAGVEVEQLDLQRGDWDRNKGQEIAQNDLAKFGDEIEVVFCNNDDMAIGALQAITAAGRKVNENIYLVGVDALDAALNEVAAGNMTGTVLNDAKGQAEAAVEAMEGLLGGKTYAAGEQSIYVDYVKVTPDNVKDFQ